jgi:hypothetical protein
VRVYDGIYNASSSERIQTLTPNRWQSFSINMTRYVESLRYEKATDYQGLASYGSEIQDFTVFVTSRNKMQAEYYVDHIKLGQTVGASTWPYEVVYRNTNMSHWDSDSFKAFPAVEFSMKTAHMNYFAWNFTDVTQYVDSSMAPISRRPAAAVSWAHSQGYPIQLNHPVFTSNATAVIANSAWGADLLDTEGKYANIAVWDSLLRNGMTITGTSGTDTHDELREGMWATMIYAQSLTLSSLMQSLYEGRVVMMRNNFTGTVIFDTAGRTEPYASRYVQYVYDYDRPKISLSIDGGLGPGWVVSWILNGAYVENTTIAGSQFSTTRMIPIPKTTDYWRVEIRTAAGRLVVMSEPIFFKHVGIPYLYFAISLAAIVAIVAIAKLCGVRRRKPELRELGRTRLCVESVLLRLFHRPA